VPYEKNLAKIDDLILDLQRTDDEEFTELMDQMVSKALDAKDERVDEANSDDGAADIKS
jgi:hypothetical protein